jgi:hypothetical protein
MGQLNVCSPTTRMPSAIWYKAMTGKMATATACTAG